MTDAASSRRSSAKPRDGAHGAPKLRNWEASPTWVLWTEGGVGGGGDGISAGGTRSPSRFAGGSGAPSLDRTRPNAAPARRTSATASESSQRSWACVGPRHVPLRGASMAAGRTREDVSPENINGTIDGWRLERRAVSTFDQRKCSTWDEVFSRLAPRRGLQPRKQPPGSCRRLRTVPVVHATTRPRPMATSRFATATRKLSLSGLSAQFG